MKTRLASERAGVTCADDRQQREAIAELESKQTSNPAQCFPMKSPRSFAFLTVLALGAVGLGIPATGAPGDLDPSFGVGGSVRFGFGGAPDRARAVAVQADGKLVVAGTCFNGGGSDFMVLRVLADGSLDPSFGRGGVVVVDQLGYQETAHGLALDGLGRVVVAGESGGLFGVIRLESMAAELRITAIHRLVTGEIMLEGKGMPGATHTLCSSEGSSAIDFMPLGPVVPDGTGFREFQDDGASGFPLRLYQLTFP